MSTLEQATQPLDPKQYEPVSTATMLTPPPFTSQDITYSITPNVNLRSPAPPVNVSPDNLRQYYKGGQLPQYRVWSPPTLSAQSASSGGTTVNNVTSTSSSSSTTVKSPTAQTVGFSTPVLLVGQIYPTILQIAKAFSVLKVTVSSSARIELYKTAAAQNADLSRPVTQPVYLGTQNGIICDLNLVNSNELMWICSPDFPGSNGDSPQSTSIYTTITNTGVASAVIIVSIVYVQTES